MAKKKYRVHGLDKNGDVWIVDADLKESAESIANQFRRQGYSAVTVSEIK